MTKDKLDSYLVPKHIAIIMDGNRRWAKIRGLNSLAGHREGAEVLEKVVEAAAGMGVKVLTVYALSTENIKERPKNEVLGLFRILTGNFQTKFQKMMRKGVLIKVLGEMKGLPQAVRGVLDKLNQTRVKDVVIRLNIAFNYGSRNEIVTAIKRILEEGTKADKISESLISEHLYTGNEVDPELIIRTGGNMRLSNFLLWQGAYSELYFMSKLWPDFKPGDLKKAILWYHDQKRNFGR